MPFCGKQFKRLGNPLIDLYHCNSMKSFTHMREMEREGKSSPEVGSRSDLESEACQVDHTIGDQEEHGKKRTKGVQSA